MAAISRTVSLRQLQSCNVCVVGGGLVGAATAMALAEAGVDGVRVLNGSACGMPSSSNDVSRLVGVREDVSDSRTRVHACVGGGERDQLCSRIFF